MTAKSWLTRAVSRSGARQPGGVRSRGVVCWHALLRAIAVLNVVLWSLAAVAVTGAGAGHLQLLLSAGYVLGCAFRCVLPVYDIPRLVLVNSRLSSVLVGRSVATVAELCFAAQWALLLHRTAAWTHSPFAQAASLAIVPLIVLAELCSWHAVLTTSQRGHMFENSIWGLSATLVVASILVIGPHRLADQYPPLIAWCVGGAVYAAFIFFFDVPMYRSRWLADQSNGRQYLSIGQGLVDICRRWIVSHRWEDWKDEVLWMSAYFSLGVWSSISLIYASAALGAHRG